MQAVILSGGQGTRLRPLTSTMPKPAVPMVGRPMLWHMIQWLKGHGVTDVVMSMGYKADDLREAIDAAGHDGVAITWIEEPEPLGTAGAVGFAAEHLEDRFLVLNGDTLTDFDLSAEIRQHEKTGARATIALVPVDDPTAYGVVVSDEQHRVQAFLEKPRREDAPPDPRINAGAYVLEHDVLELIPSGEPCSFEHDVFPQLVGNGAYSFDADGYWLDLGTPERYVQATRDLLAGRVQSWLDALRDADGNVIAPSADCAGAEIVAPVVIGEQTVLADGAVVGPDSVLGASVNVAVGAEIRQSVLMDGVQVAENALIEDSLVAPGVQIAAGARLRSGCVVGENAVVAAGQELADARVEAGEAVGA